MLFLLFVCCIDSDRSDTEEFITHDSSISPETILENYHFIKKDYNSRILENKLIESQYLIDFSTVHTIKFCSPTLLRYILNCGEEMKKRLVNKLDLSHKSCKSIFVHVLNTLRTLNYNLVIKGLWYLDFNHNYNFKSLFEQWSSDVHNLKSIFPIKRLTVDEETVFLKNVRILNPFWISQLVKSLNVMEDAITIHNLGILVGKLYGQCIPTVEYLRKALIEVNDQGMYQQVNILQIQMLLLLPV